jgi:protein-disulfide isomerase
MHDILFTEQDAIGSMPYLAMAEDAGVPDLVAFDACMSSTQMDSVLQADLGLALRLGARGTPAVVIDGELLRFVPDSAGLAAIFRSLEGE